MGMTANPNDSARLPWKEASEGSERLLVVLVVLVAKSPEQVFLRGTASIRYAAAGGRGVIVSQVMIY